MKNVTARRKNGDIRSTDTAGEFGCVVLPFCWLADMRVEETVKFEPNFRIWDPMTFSLFFAFITPSHSLSAKDGSTRVGCP